jgi:hypothetical protein
MGLFLSLAFLTNALIHVSLSAFRSKRGKHTWSPSRRSQRIILNLQTGFFEKCPHTFSFSSSVIQVAVLDELTENTLDQLSKYAISYSLSFNPAYLDRFSQEAKTFSSHILRLSLRLFRMICRSSYDVVEFLASTTGNSFHLRWKDFVFQSIVIEFRTNRYSFVSCDQSEKIPVRVYDRSGIDLTSKYQ